jgi:putative PIN family toxin of toxin-antitoxin system
MDLVSGGAFKLLLSQYLLDEVARTLRYPRLQARFGLSSVEIDEYVSRLHLLAEVVEPATALLPILPDPQDDPVLLTAWAGQADVLCSNDLHFYHPAAKAFCTRYRILRLTDLELLRLCRLTGI